MRNAIKTAVFTVLAMSAALRASAEVTASSLTHDPLTNQIMSRQLTQAGGGVTGAVRIGSGQAISLNLADPLTTATEPLKDAVADPKALTALKPAEGLAEKPVVKAKSRRKIRRATEQLKKMSDDERKADWSGRK